MVRRSPRLWLATALLIGGLLVAVTGVALGASAPPAPPRPSALSVAPMTADPSPAELRRLLQRTPPTKLMFLTASAGGHA